METPANTPQGDANIDALLNRINGLAGGSAPAQATAPPPAPEVQLSKDMCFIPQTPRNFQEAGISEAMTEELVCKYLLAVGEASVRQITNQVALPFHMAETIVNRLKSEQVLGYIGSGAMNDHICRLTEVGRERAKRYSSMCTYFGAAPIAFEDYVESVKKQTINDQHPSEEDLNRAFSDLLIDPSMMIKLGPAVNSGKGMFLFGYPGNGKTSIAERITRAFGRYVWIPRAVTVDRDLIRLFDPMSHIEAPLKEGDGLSGQ